MVIIIGAGLSGLLTAYRLKKEGIPFKVVEARNRVGGRIHTLYGKNSTPVEMGATWFTRQHQHLIALLNELALPYFEQHMGRTAFYQANASTAARLIPLPNQAPSYRISGGSSQLIQSLFEQLNPEDVFLDQPVQKIKIHKSHIEIIANETFKGDQVVLALPPKLWSKRITFEPAILKSLSQVAEETHTWMEDSIKVALTYKHPFWQESELSGSLFSNSGPLTEFYDHCNHERSKYALCGFMNPAFKDLNLEERKAVVIAQLKPIYGDQVTNFIDYHECSWSAEEHTFEASENFLLPHQNNGHPVFRDPIFNNNVFISSSETATDFPGYMDGAVAAAQRTANQIISIKKKSVNDTI